VEYTGFGNSRKRGLLYDSNPIAVEKGTKSRSAVPKISRKGKLLMKG
jgi:hypothetical protein